MSTQEISKNFKNVEEKELNPISGGLMLILVLAMYAASVGLIICGAVTIEMGKNNILGGILVAGGIFLLIAAFILTCGFHMLKPNEELVLTFFGKYYGTIKKDGYYFVNPFASEFNPTSGGVVPQAIEITAGGGEIVKNSVATQSTRKKISTKTQTLRNDKQKVNDVLGNPIIIGSVVIWRVAEPTKAVFNVENYKEFLSIQCDSVIRNIARMYRMIIWKMKPMKNHCGAAVRKLRIACEKNCRKK